MQIGFDFTGLRAELGERYEGFVQQWTELQQLLGSRGSGALEAGRMLASFESAYGTDWLMKVLSLSKAPGVQRARMLITAYQVLHDADLSDAQLAVLDTIVYTRMKQEARLRALRMILDGKSTQEIDDFIDGTRPPPGGENPPTQNVTEEDVRLSYVEALRKEGYRIQSAEVKTADDGRVDILASLPGKQPIMVECKVTLDRSHVIEALGQLTLYSQTFRGREWHIAYWKRDDNVQPIIDACQSICLFAKVSLTAKAGV